MAQVSRNCLGGQGDKAIDHKVFAVSFVISNTYNPVGIYTVNGIGKGNNIACAISEEMPLFFLGAITKVPVQKSQRL